MTKRLIGTATTDANGIATITYESTSAGDIDIIAECEDSNDTLLSETFVVQDYWKYDPTEYSYTKSSGGVKNQFIDNSTSLSLPSDFELEIKAKTTGGTGSNEHRVFIMPRSLFVSDSQPRRGVIFDNIGCSNGIWFGYRENNTTQSRFGISSKPFTCNNYHTVKITKVGNTSSFYFDGTLVASNTNITYWDSYSDWCPCFHLWNNGTYYLKDFIIKKL